MARLNHLRPPACARLALASCLAFSTCLTFSASALADEDRDEARVLYQKANAAFKGGDDVMAREYYRQSLALDESFDTMCNLGRTLARSKLFPEAYERLRMCIYLYPEDEELASAREKFVQLRDEVRRELSFDQQHELDTRVDDEIARREEAKKAPASGLEEAEPAPEPEAEAVATAEPSEEKSSGAKWPVVITTGSLGVIGIGTGIGFLVASGSQKSEAESLRDSLTSQGVDCSDPSQSGCAELSSAAKKTDSYKTVGIAGLAAGGALLAGATLAYFLWPEGDADTASLTPQLEWGENGSWKLGLSGTF